MKHTEYLKYTFSETELREFAKSLARENTAAAEAEEEKKSVVASFAERITTAKATISRLSRFITSGYEYRNIECALDFHTPSEGMKTITRLDTGEVVKTVAMSAEEKQEKLFKDEAPTEPEATA